MLIKCHGNNCRHICASPQICDGRSKRASCCLVSNCRALTGWQPSTTSAAPPRSARSRNWLARVSSRPGHGGVRSSRSGLPPTRWLVSHPGTAKSTPGARDQETWWTAAHESVTEGSRRAEQVHRHRPAQRAAEPVTADRWHPMPSTAGSGLAGSLAVAAGTGYVAAVHPPGDPGRPSMTLLAGLANGSRT